MARRSLSNEVKQGILDGLKNGVKPTELSVKFGVSIPTIYNYRKSQLVVATETTTAALSGFATPTEVGTVTTTVTNRAARKSNKRSR